MEFQPTNNNEKNYNIKPHEVIFQNSDFQIYDGFYSDLFYNFCNLVTDILRSKDPELISQLDIEYYDPKKHFYFVDRYEEHRQLLKKSDYKMILAKGYCFESHRFPKRENEQYSVSDFEEAKYSKADQITFLEKIEKIKNGGNMDGFLIPEKYQPEFWEIPITETLKNDLPERLKKNTRENTIELLEYISQENNAEQEKEIQFQLSRHAINNPRIYANDIDEASRWTVDIIHFRHSNIIVKNTHLEDDELFTYFFALTLANLRIDEVHDFLVYNLKVNFKSDFKYFTTKVKMVCWKYESKFMTPERINYIKELLLDISKNVTLEKKPNEESDDNTDLNDLTGNNCPEFDAIFMDIKTKNEVWEYMIDLKMIDSNGNYKLGKNRSYLYAFITVMKKHSKIPPKEMKPLIRAFTLKLLGKDIRINESYESKDYIKQIEKSVLIS